MPPKKKEPKGPSAKTIQKEKAKIVEDKTFGLKNKNKSKVVQNYVKQVSSQVMDGGNKKVSRLGNAPISETEIKLVLACAREVTAPERKQSSRRRPRRRSRPPRRPSLPPSSRELSRSKPPRMVKVSGAKSQNRVSDSDLSWLIS